MRLRPNEIVDVRYRLVDRIGSGGMADVWRATDTELDRDVALKVLHENFARDKEFVERFRREASSAAGLQHPNVVSVYDRGTWEDTYYIAMELVEGSSLRDLINRGLEIPESIEVARQVLAAASFAHARGIVHRDLKPLNVLIDRSGRIQVTDFGIARAANSEITQTGSVMGTAQYLSPEQAQGMETTATSDIYSIGVMLFEMLTGRVPFDGDNAVAIAMKQVGETPPPPSQLNPNVSPALDAVVLKALAKEPANRFASAAEMIAALDAAEANPGGGHTERFALLVGEGDDDDRPWWLIAGIVALILACVALAYFLTRPDLADVPGVTGQMEAQATIVLQDAGFEVDPEQVENPAPEDTVIEQDPRGGTEAEEGSTVTITVSLGPGTVEVPRVSGLKPADARRVLRQAGFESAVKEQSSANVPNGKVIGSEPPQGTQLKVGETVTLTVSTGVATEAVPSVVGLSRTSATTQLREAGFIVNAEFEDSDEPEDQVLSQSPVGGTSARANTEVTIVVSSGVGTLSLDDFVGQEADFAADRLNGAGLEVSIIEREVTEASEDGVVLAQAPPPGTRLSPGDRVTLTVGVFVEPEETTTTDTTNDTTDTTTTTTDPTP